MGTFILTLLIPMMVVGIVQSASELDLKVPGQDFLDYITRTIDGHLRP